METRKLQSENRSNLNFKNEVMAAFDFLPNLYDLNTVSAGSTFVRYESAKVFVNVYHGRSSYELGIEIGLLESPRSEGKGYTISELMRLAKDKECDEFMRPVAHTAEKVQKGILLLSSLLRKYGGGALSGDPNVFEELSVKRLQWNTRFAHDIHVRKARAEANLAFQQKKYWETVKVYESIIEDLLPSERKKLEYARRKLRGQKGIPMK